VILHYHIFKNAGTTIYSILERHFGSRLASLESGHFNSMLRNEAFLDFLQRRPKLRAVSTHHLLPPKPEHPDFVFHDVLFLRNPLARLSSMRDFYRRSEITEDPLTSEAKHTTTAEFMRLLIEKYPQHVNNAQVSCLSARILDGKEPNLQMAFNIACQTNVLGVTELFDVGAILAEQSLAPFFGSINFGDGAQNLSSMAPRELSVHLRQFRDACGETVYEKLVSSNSLDLALLEVATREVHRRFEAIPDHDERLKHFVTWRSILHPSAIRGVLASNHPDDFVRYANSRTK
jgi:hypothetical protein